MSEEDERTLWCGNLSEKVTEEMLYELFLQAGPVEMVKIPRDPQNPKRQRSYAFITYAHSASIEYAINIYEGTKLFQRPLTLHRKSRNGPNQGASPRVNNNGTPNQNRGPHQQHNQSPNQQQQQSPGGYNGSLQLDQNQFGGGFNQAMFNQMLASLQGMRDTNMQMMGQLPQGHHQNKMNRSHQGQQQQQQQKPYSRGDRNSAGDEGFSRDRGRGGPNRGGGGGANHRRNDYRGRR
ncbi:RNA-binding protein 7-like [Uranotaenia lowii]|uniref:RNA-binding protein 7-like n=1 Tax=Uranotaenia lowii TaxID=190385 RepID=UPI002478C514|nr:RNA-binding protein 7-like [Uranotaenia lowii]XP_055610458.1 RNA-binding protein 7-like [Uranotaenia lowii]